MIENRESKTGWLIGMLAVYVLGHIGAYISLEYLLTNELLALLPVIITLIPAIGTFLAIKGKIFKSTSKLLYTVVAGSVVYLMTWLFLIYSYWTNIGRHNL